jgi:hypothetical protein
LRPPRKAGASDRRAGGPAGDRLGDLSFTGFVSAWNGEQGRPTPDLHLRMTRWLDRCWSEGDRRLLLMVFRDAGKSTLVGMFCAWLLGRAPDLRLLVLSAESALAAKMTRNVRRLIERHPMLAHLLPRRREEWAADQLTVRREANHRDPSLLARGIGANITGCRADIVICDDVEVPNTADTHPKRRELRERLREIGFVLVPDGTQLYIGTPHIYHSIYADQQHPELGDQAPFLDGYTRLTLPLLDEGASSLWPDRFAPPAIRELRADSGPLRFRSQMILSPAHTREIRLDPDRLVRYEAPLQLHDAHGELVLTIDGRRMVGAACWWDPAMGRPDRGDASVVAAVFTDDSGGYWLHGIRYLTVDETGLEEADAAAQLCHGVINFLREHEQPAIAIETNGLGKFLPLLLRRELKAQGLAVTVTEQVSTRAKDQRILDAFDPLLAARALRVHASVWDTPFIREMREWLPGGGGADDGLDAVSGCILSQPVRLSARAAAPPRRDWRGAAATFRAQTTFLP